MFSVVVTTQWDPETKVWVAFSPTLGFVSEANSLDDLVQKLRRSAPDLIKLNMLPDFKNVYLEVEVRLAEK